MFNSPSRRVYLGRLPATFEKEDVEKHLASYGTIVECKVMDGFGFVEFLNLKDAEDVVETFSRQSFLGEHIVMEFAKPPRNQDASSQSPPTTKSASTGVRVSPVHAQLRYRVWVFNLSQWTRWQDLKDFGRTGGFTVAYSDIDPVDPTLGFIEYLSSEDAKAAAKQLDKTELRGNIVRVRTQQQVNRAKRSRSRSRSPVRHSEHSKQDSRHTRRIRYAWDDWETQNSDQRNLGHEGSSSTWWTHDSARYH